MDTNEHQLIGPQRSSAVRFYEKRPLKKEDHQELGLSLPQKNIHFR
jgi:hypothetical protein